MTYSSCSHENPPAAKFCLECGSPVAGLSGVQHRRASDGEAFSERGLQARAGRGLRSVFRGIHSSAYGGGPPTPRAEGRRAMTHSRHESG